MPTLLKQVQAANKAVKKMLPLGAGNKEEKNNDSAQRVAFIRQLRSWLIAFMLDLIQKEKISLFRY